MTTRQKISLLVLLAAIAVGGAAFYFWPVPPGGLPCARQAPEQFTAQCLAQAQGKAARGDVGAMVALSRFFATRQPAEAQRWTREAARHGDQRAIAAVLAGCGAGKPFSVQDAESVLARATPLEALHFRLGGSCGSADMAAARTVKPQEVLAAPDTAGLCKVAVRYGLLRISRDGAKLDGEGAAQMLAECERRNPPAAVRKEAEMVRQMLAREIRPVHINVE